MTATLSVSIGKAIFGLPLHIAPATLLVSMALFIAAMWGFSMIVGAAGVALRNANQLSNLMFPILQLVAGTLYPISLMPGWIEVPARCLPFGYGIQAMVDSVTEGASLSRRLGRPVAAGGLRRGAARCSGIAAFRAVERRTRRSAAPSSWSSAGASPPPLHPRQKSSFRRRLRLRASGSNMRS